MDPGEYAAAAAAAIKWSSIIISQMTHDSILSEFRPIDNGASAAASGEDSMVLPVFHW